MSKKAVIFDLDGTLTNTLRSIQKTTNLVLETFGLEPYEIDRYRYFVGDGAAELVKRAFSGRGCVDESVIERAVAQYHVEFEKYCMYEVKPYEGIQELLTVCKERGILLAVNSNKPHARTIDVVEEIFGKGTFDCLVGQSPDRKRKPSPDGIHLILDTFGLSKEDVIYLGDTSTDMLTGHNAEVYTVGALWGFRDEAELREYNADAIISYPMDLLPLIESK